MRQKQNRKKGLFRNLRARVKEGTQELSILLTFSVHFFFNVI